MTGAAAPDPLAGVPPDVRSRLEDLRGALVAALGDHLRALLVYGSAVRGGFRPGDSDVDVLLVLREATRAQLESISNALLLARHAARIEAIILSEGEIARAADVFPLFYDDIRGHHVVLHGGEPFTGVTISDRHRRLRIEQELREAQIRLRRLVVDAGPAAGTLGNALARKLRQLRGPLHALLALRGVAVDDGLTTVLDAAGRAFHVDTAPLHHPHEAAGKAHDALAALLDAAVAAADAMEDP